MGYITVSEEIDAYALKDRLWSGAEDTMQRIIDEDKEDAFFTILSDLHCDKDSIDLTEINDLLRFEEDQVFEWLGINNKDVKETELTLSETDCDILMVDEDLISYIRKAIEEAPTPYLATDIYTIEEEFGRELTEDEIEELIRVGEG
jgi:vacuolar-type H+-ATPase subunit F/Vma7